MRRHRVARVRQNVLIRGEEGTGKELMAAYIHRHSENPASPYVIANCALHSEELFVAELFGHLKGAFTNATEVVSGRHWKTAFCMAWVTNPPCSNRCVTRSGAACPRTAPAPE